MEPSYEYNYGVLRGTCLSEILADIRWARAVRACRAWCWLFRTPLIYASVWQGVVNAQKFRDEAQEGYR